MEPTGVVTADDPGTSQDAPQGNTLDNLDANIAAELGSQTGESAGDATEAPTQTPGEPAAAPASPAKEEPEAEADQAKMQRISQQNANLRAIVTKFGVDPDSDTADAVRTGMVTVEDVMRSRQPIAPTAQPEASSKTAPTVTLDQKLTNVKNLLEKPVPKEGISAEDYLETQKAFMGVMTDLAQANQNIVQSNEQREAAEEAGRMVAATNDVFNAAVVSEVSTQLPEEIRQVAAEMFLGATHIDNYEAQRIFGPDKANTPEGYRHSATQIAPKMKRFIEAIYVAGQKSANPNFVPAPTVPATPNAPNVMRPGVGAGSPPAPVPKGKFTIENLEANANAYVASRQAQV